MSTTTGTSQSTMNHALVSPDQSVQQCFCLPYLSPHRQHSYPNAKVSSNGTRPGCGPRRTSYFSSALPPPPPSQLPPPPPPPPQPPPPPNIPAPPPDQCIHPYEFYDHFCSTNWTNGSSRQPQWTQSRGLSQKSPSMFSTQQNNHPNIQIGESASDADGVAVNAAGEHA
ncbi:unnamed protein product [Echinostoma caproni]|uniref:Uncharacterized protein n=1 Tax=Echinostoma caproni TaxID=27848 RepID=A0A183A5R7_9TREM|nr:unnamed protein product [Echinostoma caproni]